MKPKHAVDCKLYPVCRCNVTCMADDIGERRPADRLEGATLLALVVAVLLCAWALLAASYAQAHDALPTAAQSRGWSYPFACCSGYDYREVADKAVGEQSQGYVIGGQAR